MRVTPRRLIAIASAQLSPAARRQCGLAWKGTTIATSDARSITATTSGITGKLVHPQLLRRYEARASAGEGFAGTVEERTQAIASHFDVIIGAVEAGREELVRLHRANRIDNDTLRSLEMDLDLEELGAVSAKA